MPFTRWDATPGPHARRAGRHRTAVALALAIALWGCGYVADADVGEVYDWCAPVVVRPDQRFRDLETCTPFWTPEEIAKGARVVLLGTHFDVTDPAFDRGVAPCRWPYTHEDNGRYVARIRALRAAQGGAPIAFIHMHRFDHVSESFVALPGFDPSFLLTARTPWRQVTRFFSEERGAPCAPEGCTLSDAPAHVERAGRRGLHDWIDARGSPGAAEGAVYYLSRSGPGQRHFWTVAALADLDNPKYRAWRVAEARRAVAAGGYDAIMISQKFHQYRRPAQHWLGSPQVPDVAALNARRDTLWTARPDGYGFEAYVRGFGALARELRAAGVPYAVSLPAPPFQWRADDPATALDEAGEIRRAARGADYVLLSRARRSAGVFDRAVRELAQDGAIVIPVDPSCGQRGET